MCFHKKFDGFRLWQQQWRYYCTLYDAVVNDNTDEVDDIVQDFIKEDTENCRSKEETLQAVLLH
jgi:hypothetical protein